ncbi:ABC transporter permease [Solicola gregarius]|uniref:ABC transporter permease n=1 Tax=Solicola gregarius TaxID=2908642 RepID=A0AA46TH03_9ACTN|nr:ABC transporter permease [Solicola gregarius]UYM04669.1 ABC transporter permease [Solicola gregarius]
MAQTVSAPPGVRTLAQRAGGVGVASRKVALGTLGFVFAIAVWWLLAEMGVGNGRIPLPSKVVTSTRTMFAEQQLLMDVRVSLTRVLIGVAIGCGLALPVGYLLAWFRPIRETFEPLVNFGRAIPPIALIPLAIPIFGIGESARISILVFAAFFSSVVVLFEGISSIDPVLVRAARALGANPWEIFARVAVPAAVPHVFTAVRVAIGVSWATLVAAELIAAEQGIGAAINDAKNFNRMADVCVGIIMVGVCALLMDGVLKAAQRQLTKWQEKSG